MNNNKFILIINFTNNASIKLIVFCYFLIKKMSKNSQNFRSSSVQPAEKQSKSVMDLYNQKYFTNRNNVSSYSLNQSQQNFLLGENENHSDLSFSTSANLNCQDYHPSQKYLNTYPQICVNSSKLNLNIWSKKNNFIRFSFVQ